MVDKKASDFVLSCTFVQKLFLAGRGAGAEPDIFIWGDHWRGRFCNKGSCQWSV